MALDHHQFLSYTIFMEKDKNQPSFWRDGVLILGVVAVAAFVGVELSESLFHIEL